MGQRQSRCTCRRLNRSVRRAEGRRHGRSSRHRRTPRRRKDQRSTGEAKQMRQHMRCLKSVVVAVVVVAAAAFAAGQILKIDFEKDDVGKPPKGFSFALTGQGNPGAWIIRKDDQMHGNVLVQTDPDRTDYRFPVAVYDDFSGKDVDLSVQFKAISGKGDQGAGIVWRYRDPNNYYITRCNALEDNCTIYHVINGRRVGFLNQKVKVASNVWHTLRVEAVADHFVLT